MIKLQYLVLDEFRAPTRRDSYNLSYTFVRFDSI
jgi:hypothetical protein